jgi:hypothetical protein
MPSKHPPIGISLAAAANPYWEIFRRDIDTMGKRVANCFNARLVHLLQRLASKKFAS